MTTNLSKENKEKLQQLLYSNDFESVVQGLDLLEALVEDEHDIYDFFDLTDKIPSKVDDLEKHCKYFHFGYVILWIIRELGRKGVRWVVELDTLHCDDYFIEGICVLPNIEKLRVRFQFFSEFPEDICKLPNLKDLEFDCIELPNWPDTLTGLESLKRLTLIGNELTTLPGFVTKCYTLEELWLKDNEITIIPESIGSLTKLKTLDLTWNYITSLPTTIAKLTNLNDLYLSGIGLSNLSESELEDFFASIAKLPVLVQIDIGENNLTKLPESFWSIAPPLIIYMCNNNLSMTAEEIKEGLNAPDMQVEI